MKSSAQLGFALQRAAHVAVPLVALAITLIQLVFWFGGEFRLALEERNDQFAAWWVSVLGLAPCVTGFPVTASPASYPSQLSQPSEPSEPLPVLVAAPKPIARKAERAPKPRPARRARRRVKVEALAA